MSTNMNTNNERTRSPLFAAAVADLTEILNRYRPSSSQRSMESLERHAEAVLLRYDGGTTTLLREVAKTQGSNLSNVQRRVRWALYVLCDSIAVRPYKRSALWRFTGQYGLTALRNEIFGVEMVEDYDSDTDADTEEEDVDGV